MSNNGFLLEARYVFRLICFCCFTSSQLVAQDWLGFNSDNYAGVHQAQIQPAAIVGGPYKLDVNLVTLDLLGLNAEYFSNFKVLNDLNELKGNTFLDVFKQGESEYLINGNIFLPSAIYQLDKKSAIGLGVRARANFFIKGSSSDFTDLILNDFNIEEFYGRTFEDAFFTSRYATWTEYNFTYARELINTDKHRLTAGISPKLLIGQSAGYFSADNIKFRLENSDLLTDLSGTINYGYDKDIGQFIQEQKIELFGKSSLGLDVGIQYEIKLNEDGDESANNFYDPGYKWKFGLSSTDIGAMKFEKSPGSGDYAADVQNFPLDRFDDIESFAELADSLNTYFFGTYTASDFKVQLPSTIRVLIDYKIRKYFYANFAAALAVSGTDRAIFETRNLNLYALTFRYERPHLGFTLPVSYNRVVKLNVGASTRWGPFILGSGNVITSLIQNDPNFINVYVGFKFSLLQPEFRKRKQNSNKEFVK